MAYTASEVLGNQLNMKTVCKFANHCTNPIEVEENYNIKTHTKALFIFS